LKQSAVVGSSIHRPPFSQVTKLHAFARNRKDEIMVRKLFFVDVLLPFWLGHWSTIVCRTDRCGEASTFVNNNINEKIEMTNERKVIIIPSIFVRQRKVIIIEALYISSQRMYPDFY